MKPSFQYETKLFVVHFVTDETAIDVYAMDHDDLWATLKEQIPNLNIQDISHIEEHHCASVQDTLH
jgi:hypothetical protein